MYVIHDVYLFGFCFIRNIESHQIAGLHCETICLKINYKVILDFCFYGVLVVEFLFTFTVEKLEPDLLFEYTNSSI